MGSGCSGQRAKYIALLRPQLAAEQFHVSRAEKCVASADFSANTCCRLGLVRETMFREMAPVLSSGISMKPSILGHYTN
jgi:hypothetical protein